MDGLASTSQTSQIKSARIKEANTLSSLFEKAQRLQSRQATSTAQLPQVQLSLDQIESQSRRSAARVQQKQYGQEFQAGEEAKAQYILGQAAVDTTALAHTLERLDPLSAFAPLAPLQDNDIEGLLRHANEINIINAINEGRLKIVRDFYKSLEEKSRKEWDQRRSEIFEELGAHSFGRDTGASASSRGLDGDTAMATGTSDSKNPLASHPRMMMYDRVVLRLNKCRMENRPIALAHAFGEANSSMHADSKSTRATKMWRLIAYLTNETDVVDGEFKGPVIQERAYARAYLSADPENDSAAIDLREQIRNGALAFLEDLFAREVNRELSDNPAEAELGGDPTIENKIRAFVQLRIGKQNRWSGLGVYVADSTPIWARLFYLLRAGQVKSAKKFATDYSHLFDRQDEGFVGYFNEWLDALGRRLTTERQRTFMSRHYEKIKFTSATGTPPDPFRVALCKLIGRAELSRKKLPAAADTVEDWLWIQLSLVRERGAHLDPAHERYKLRDLGKVLTSYGESHFGALYFDVLLLSGQFELAIAHLWNKTQHQVDSVHYAIALCYYGLLRVPSHANLSELDILSIDPNGQETASLNFAKIIYRYQRLFDRSAPEYALEYLCLIPLAGKHTSTEIENTQIALCHNYIKELVAHSKAYPTLLGDVSPSGQRTPGAVENHGALISKHNPEAYLKSLIREVAETANLEKRFEDTILLYNLAEDYSTVLRVINNELGASLSKPSSNANLPTESNSATGENNLTVLAHRDITVLAETILNWYNQSNKLRDNQPNGPTATCQVLIKLKKAMTLFESGQYENALTTITETNLIPLNGDVSTVIRYQEQFDNVDDTITKHFGTILLTTMKILSKLYNTLKESVYGDAARQNKMSEIRDQAKSLMMFAGMLRFRLTSEIYEQLTRLDVYLH